MFFVVGTGRCGSLSLANTLLEQTDCVCLHEPEPGLAEHAAAYRSGGRTASELREALRRGRAPQLNGKTYGEADPALALIIAPLREAFPDAHFLWLIRNGLDTVASASGQGWFAQAAHSGQPHQQPNVPRRRNGHPIEGDRCGAVDALEWRRMSPFEKCCWYWQYVNRTIEGDLTAHVAPLRFRKLAVEELEDQLDDAIAWLGLRRLRREPPAHQGRTRNPVNHWTGWGPEQWAAFERWCGNLMDRHYPRWREATGCGRAAVPAASQAGAAPRSAPSAALLLEEGEARFQAGDYAGARELFERAAAQDAANPAVFNNLAVCLWAAGDTAQALLYAARGLELAPDDRDLVINSGGILQSCGRPVDAEALYNSYLADFPGEGEVRQALEELQSRTQREVGPGHGFDPDALNTEGERFFTAGDLDAAADCFTRALKAAPAHIDALNNLGVVRWRHGDQAGALEFLTRALERDPERRETVVNLAALLDEMGRYDTLTVLLDACVQGRPYDMEMRALRDSYRLSGSQAGVRAAGAER